MVYRDKKPINWCCSLKSAISDAEVNKSLLFETYELKSYKLYSNKVDNLVVSKRTYLKIPNYEKPIEFGVIYELAYQVHDSGKVLF